MNPQPPQPRVVIKNNTFREAAIATACGLVVLALLVFGIGQLSDKPAGNRLSGEIVVKRFIPAPEEQITYGKQGLKTKTIEGEYLFEVRVKAENRTFEVPVDKYTYSRRKVGDTQTFVRPPSEQK